MDTTQTAGDTPPFWCPEPAFKREGRSRQSCVLGGPRGVIGAMAITVGYARVSTTSQHLDMQLDALTASGCTRIHTDTASGALSARPGLDQALAELDEGDTLVVWRLDRLGRSLPHLVATIDTLTRQGVNLKSLHEAIDTTTPTGRLMVHLIASLAEFERELTIERTIAGLEAARARGASIGRPTVWTPQRAEAASALLAAGATVTEVAQALNVSRATVYRHANPSKTAQAAREFSADDGTVVTIRTSH